MQQNSGGTSEKAAIASQRLHGSAGIPCFVRIVNFEGKILQCNSALEKTLGYPKSELLARHLIDFTHPDDMLFSLNCLKEFIDGNKKLGLGKGIPIHELHGI